jgi:hypothetical protein
MNKTSLLFGFLIVVFSATSCTKDETAQNSNTSQNLASITKQFYTNNSLTSYIRYNLSYNKLVNIQYSDNSYDDIYYEGDLVSKILEFDITNNWEWATTYTYDSFNRLTQKKVVPNPNNTIIDVSRQKDVVYDGNIIHSENSWSDGGFHKNTIVLNSENLMIEDQQFNAANEVISRRFFEYVNNNLSKQTIKTLDDVVIMEESFVYLDKVKSESSVLNTYLFGIQWKNNSSLNNQFGLGQITPFDVSENYISEYHINFLLNNTSKSGTFTYEFDANEHIIKQTEHINWSTGELYKVITIYEYD